MKSPAYDKSFAATRGLWLGGAMTAIAAMSWLVAAGCSRAEREADSTADTLHDFTPTTFCAAYADGWCDYLERCEKVDTAFHDECVRAVKSTTCDGAAASAKLGQRTFSAKDAKSCVSELRHMTTCEEGGFFEAKADIARVSAQFFTAAAPALPLYRGACARVFAAGAEAGASCSTLSDCVPAAEGDTPITCATSDGCSGTCVVQGSLGSPCETTHAVVGGCKERDGLTCHQGRCVPRFEDGHTCLRSFECASALCQGGVCTPKRSAGESCANGEPCAEGLRCGEGAICVTAAGLGDTCVAVPLAGTGSCKRGLFCSLGGSGSNDGGASHAPPPGADAGPVFGVCAALAGPGEPCEGTYACREGLCSRRDGGFCPRFGDLDAACSAAAPCKGGLLCDAVLRTCQKPHGVESGNPCTLPGATKAGGVELQTIHCQDGATCQGVSLSADGGIGTAGICKAATLGSPCTRGFDMCPAGSTCRDRDATGAILANPVCVVPQAGVDACDSDRECSRDQFCASTPSGPRCLKRKPGGAVCRAENECTPPFACLVDPLHAGAATCALRGSEGDTCSSASLSGAFRTPPCKFPLECLGSVCTAVGVAGATCSAGKGGAGCLAGVCEGRDPDAGVRGTCGEAGTGGAPCDSDLDCVTGRCFAGTCTGACATP